LPDVAREVQRIDGQFRANAFEIGSTLFNSCTSVALKFIAKNLLSAVKTARANIWQFISFQS
jgi:hypothetical protein